MNSDSRPRVLVLDADMVPCLTVARSLARRGCLVDVGSHIPSSICSFSNAVRSSFQYADPLLETAAFVDWIVTHTQEQHYDLVIPVTERTLVALSRERGKLTHVKIAMPSAESLDIALDKAQTLALATSLGIRVPGGELITELEDLAELAASLHYPVVLKPARSIGCGEAGSSQLQVSYAFNSAELYAGCTHALRFGPILLQEFFPGLGVGLELIAQQGTIVYAFQHLRLHEVPLSGGGSSLRKSEPVNLQLLAASEQLVAALQWNGVAMVEFKLDAESGEFCLMEINGRFWGSLPLADAAGADFPAMLLDLELDGSVSPCAPYRNDIRCRLLSRDLYWYEAVLRGDADSRITKLPSHRSIVKELSHFVSPRHYYDIQSWRDPKPGLVDVSRILGSYAQRLQALVSERLFLRQQKRSWRRGMVSEAIAKASSMLFLCYGNINRSALADVMVRAYAEDSGITVSSAGFHLEEGRVADPVMTEVASDGGHDMSALRSTLVTPQSLHQSDIIFVMEKSHYDRLLDIDRSVAAKVFLLGAHSNVNGWSPEIRDPYGRPREYYAACYVRIEEAVDRIKSAIAIRPGE